MCNTEGDKRSNWLPYISSFLPANSRLRSFYEEAYYFRFVCCIITGDVTKTSSGIIISFLNNAFTLKPSNSEVTFTIQINGETIVKISGTITLEDTGGTLKGPDTTGGGGGGGSGGSGGGGGSSEVRTVTSIAELSALLASLSSNTLQNPYLIALNTSDITGIGPVLNNEPNKFVSLDLSGSTITTIPGFSFLECTSLTSVTIPSSVTSIGRGAFTSTSLISVTILNGVTSIGVGAFGFCASLTSVTIPDSVISIGDIAFRGCTSLISVTILNGVTSIGVGAFRECTSLTSVVIPNSVTNIGERAFGNCTSLIAINVDAANTVYSSLAGVLYNKSKTAVHTYPAGKAASSFSIPDKRKMTHFTQLQS